MADISVPIRIPGGPLGRIFRAVVKSDPRFVCAHGGRGSAKSETIAGAIATRSTLKTTQTVAIRERMNSLKESSKATIELVIQRMNLSGWTFGEYELRHRNGSRIIFRGLHASTSDSIRSLAGTDIAWADEAHSISDHSLRTLLPTIRKPGSQIIFSLNPEDPEQAVYRDFVAHPAYPDHTLTVQANWMHNRFFPLALNQQRLADEKRDPEMAQHVWYGEPMILSAAQIFRRYVHWDIDIGSDVPENAVPCYGMDLGLGNHPSIILRVYHWEDRIHIAAESVDTSLTQDTLEKFVGAVGVGAGDIVWSDHQALPWNRAPDGWRLQHVPKHGGGEDRGVKFIRGRRLTIHPGCKTTLHQWPRYALKVDKDGVVLPLYDDHDDDAPDCVRYALHELIYNIPQRSGPVSGLFVG